MKKRLLMVKLGIFFVVTVFQLTGCGLFESRIMEDETEEEYESIVPSIEPSVEPETVSTQPSQNEVNTNPTDSSSDLPNTTKETLIAMLENYGDKEPYSTLYEQRAACECEQVLDGEWNRTDVHSSMCGTITISGMDSEGFDVTAELMSYSHSGELECHASFVTPECAVAEFDPGYEEIQYIAFLIQDGEIVIMVTGVDYEMGFGAGVTMDGVYVNEEPTYTNANILTETYSEADLAIIQQIVPDDYYEDYFIFSTTCGVVNVAEEADGSRTIDTFVPTMGGYGYVLQITENTYTITFDDGNVFIMQL